MANYMTQINDAERVTTAMLRDMDPGQTMTLRLPTRLALETARAMAYRVGRVYGGSYMTKADFDTRVIAITRLPETDKQPT